MLSPLDATVSRVDPRRHAATATIAVGGQPAALAESGGPCLDRGPGRRHAAPARSRERRGHHGSAWAATQRARRRGRWRLWAAVDTAGVSHRGGALSTGTVDGQLATIDPAAATAEDLPPTQLLGLTNDGLVTLNHVAGPAGTRLVPDLALALPEPTDGGRTFRFRLRPGYPVLDRRARPAQ